MMANELIDGFFVLQFCFRWRSYSIDDGERASLKMNRCQHPIPVRQRDKKTFQAATA